MTDMRGHVRWVRMSHAIVAISLLVLGVTGFVILMAHPRLYWGDAGNDLTPALFELPISRNYRHAGWSATTSIGETADAISASRTYAIFNQNGWGRSLHFLAAWCLVLPGLFYLIEGLAGGHFRSHLWPATRELRADRVWQAVADHLRLRVPPGTGGPDYNVLQKLAYSSVVFVTVPLTVLSGLAMSPAIGAAVPLLPRLFGGFQSARTVHFFAFVMLVLFVVTHIVMVVVSGFRRQVRAMTWGD
jgi:thiosulfate reductase cytochrome b subunit